jgi:predicted anti-sigma-YlaC factor YlaD
MRCRKAERLLSDDLDGALGRAGKARLEAHVRTCPDCRAYRDGLARLREAVGPPEERPAEYWAGFERRLEARLDREPGGRVPAAAPSPRRRLLLWTTVGASFLLVLAAVWYAFLRTDAAGPAVWSPSGDPLASFYLEIETDPELALAVDREIKASIDEIAPALDADALVFRAADPLFWDGLSEEELGVIAAGLEQEESPGGPR